MLQACSYAANVI